MPHIQVLQVLHPAPLLYSRRVYHLTPRCFVQCAMPKAGLANSQEDLLAARGRECEIGVPRWMAVRSDWLAGVYLPLIIIIELTDLGMTLILDGRVRG